MAVRRRDFVVLGGAAAAWPLAVHAQEAAGARYARALAALQRGYANIAHPGEAARADYITRLVRLRQEAVRLKTDAWQAIDAEIKRHPAPNDADGKALSRLLVGEWESPRHDYLFRADGTWTMTPVEPGIAHGSWRIDGNQYVDTYATDPPKSFQYTIILISKRDFVFTDQEIVFYETRLK